MTPGLHHWVCCCCKGRIYSRGLTCPACPCRPLRWLPETVGIPRPSVVLDCDDDTARPKPDRRRFCRWREQSSKPLRVEWWWWWWVIATHLPLYMVDSSNFTSCQTHTVFLSTFAPQSTPLATTFKKKLKTFLFRKAFQFSSSLWYNVSVFLNYTYFHFTLQRACGLTNCCPSVLDTVGWVIWPVKIVPMRTIMCLVGR